MSSSKFNPKEPDDWMLSIICARGIGSATGGLKKKMEGFLCSFYTWFDKPYYDRQKLEAKVRRYMKEDGFV